MNLAPFVFFLCFSQQVDSPSKAYSYHNARADYYFHKGNYPEMLYHLSEKVKIDPKDTATWSDLAYYYWSMSVDDKKRSQEFKDKAMSYLQRGLESNKDSYYMWDELGRFFVYKSKDYSKAISYLEESIKRKDCINVTFHLLALCYEKTNRVNEAIATLTECVKKFPNDAKAKSELELLKS